MNSSFGAEVNPSGSSRGGLATEASQGMGEKKNRENTGRKDRCTSKDSESNIWRFQPQRETTTTRLSLTMGVRHHCLMSCRVCLHRIKNLQRVYVAEQPPSLTESLRLLSGSPDNRAVHSACSSRASAN